MLEVLVLPRYHQDVLEQQLSEGVDDNSMIFIRQLYLHNMDVAFSITFTDSWQVSLSFKTLTS